MSFTRRDSLNWAELSVTASSQLDETGVRYPSAGLSIASSVAQNINPPASSNLLYPEQVFPVGSGAPASGIWTDIVGAANEQERVVKTTPYNTQGVVWEGIDQDAANDGDGGVQSAYFNVDNTKAYRFSVWIRKRFYDADDGLLHLGPVGQGAAGINVGLFDLAGTSFSNPYFDRTHTPPSSGTGQDDWYLWVGFVYAHDHVGAVEDPDRGFWSRAGTQTTSGTTYKWKNTVFKTRTRFFQFYNANGTGQKTDFFGPRIDLVDGSEPTISELITGTGSAIVTWDTHEAEWGSDLSHGPADPDRVTVLTAGTYEVSASVAFDSQSGAYGYNATARLRLNGTTDFGPEGKGSLALGALGHDDSTLHIQTFPKTFAAGDYVSLKIDREADPTGVIDTTPGASSLYLRRIV